MTKSSYSSLSCSFCGKSQKEVKKLIAGPGVYICDDVLISVMTLSQKKKIATLKQKAPSRYPSLSI
jgi:ATP-dependent Clp protease ATP-binding subunit ClpX